MDENRRIKECVLDARLALLEALFSRGKADSSLQNEKIMRKIVVIFNKLDEVNEVLSALKDN